jgi:hypothetical protein
MSPARELWRGHLYAGVMWTRWLFGFWCGRRDHEGKATTWLHLYIGPLCLDFWSLQ